MPLTQGIIAGAAESQAAPMLTSKGRLHHKLARACGALFADCTTSSRELVVHSAPECTTSTICRLHHKLHRHVATGQRRALGYPDQGIAAPRAILVKIRRRHRADRRPNREIYVNAM